MSRVSPYPTDSRNTLMFITDLHHGRRAFTVQQLNSCGVDIDRLEDAVSGVAVGGDLIHWANAATPEDAMWNSWFGNRRKSKPWLVTAGNHDFASFGAPYPQRGIGDLRATLNMGAQNQSVDCGLFRVLTVSPDSWSRPTWDTGMVLSPATLAWLETELASSTKPAWIVGHVALSQQYSGHMDIPTNTALSNIIAQSGCVIGWLSGHRHANIHTDANHAKQVIVNGVAIAGISAPAMGGEMVGATIDPWDSPLLLMLLSYKDGVVTCRWRNAITQTWLQHDGSRVKNIEVGL